MVEKPLASSTDTEGHLNSHFQDKLQRQPAGSLNPVGLNEEVWPIKSVSSVRHFWNKWVLSHSENFIIHTI